VLTVFTFYGLLWYFSQLKLNYVGLQMFKNYLQMFGNRCTFTASFHLGCSTILAESPVVSAAS